MYHHLFFHHQQTKDQNLTQLLSSLAILLLFLSSLLNKNLSPNSSQMAQTEETPEPLKYQTWVLRVSIHCEGCKKKVKKVLQGIDGVYKITTDSQQQKVMVTGNVEAEVLIKKLGRTGKRAELWPEPKPANPDSVSNNNNNNIGGGSGGKKKKKNNNNNSNKHNEPSEQHEAKEPESDNGTASAAMSDTEPTEEFPKPDKKDSEAAAASPTAEKPSVGGGGKKKGKKGNAGGDCGGGEAPAEETQKVEVAAATAVSPVPCQHVYHYPMYQVPAVGPPTYLVSYNTAVQPLAAVGSYYIPLAASYDIFGEENANACTVM